MPADGDATRRKLVDEAARAFAEHGVYQASLIDITRQAGQKNRGALHYHFGSRTGVLCAVLERHVDFLAQREGELLEKAKHAPDDDLASVVEAIVRPATELAESGWRGRCFLQILAELVEEDPASLGPEVNAMLARTGGYEVYALMEARMPDDARGRTRRAALARDLVHPAGGRRSSPRARAARPQSARATRRRSVRDEPRRDGRGRVRPRR